MLGSRVRAPEGVQNEKRESKGSRFLFCTGRTLFGNLEGRGFVVLRARRRDKLKRGDAVHARHPFLLRTFHPSCYHSERSPCYHCGRPPYFHSERGERAVFDSTRTTLSPAPEMIFISYSATQRTGKQCPRPSYLLGYNNIGTW